MSLNEITQRMNVARKDGKRDLSVALLTNFIAPYRLPLFQALQNRVRRLDILVSVPTEPNRPWIATFDELNVILQRNITFRSSWRHPTGFSERIYLHCPYDTLPQLLRLRPDVLISGELGLRTLQASFYKALNPGCQFVIWATLSEHSEQGRG